MSYAWTITVDHIADPGAKQGTNSNAVGIVGPRSTKLTHEEIVNHPDGKKFRIVDADEELYYDGVLVGGDGLEPLDDFAGPNAGATTVKLFENGEWTAIN